MNSPTENLPEAPKDLRRICPFLGILDDPDTSLAFPSDINYCHAAEPPAVPRFDHQSTRCLALAYLGCPVYSAKEKAPLPADIRLKMKGNGVQIKIKGTALVRTTGAVIIAALIFFIGWFGVAGLNRSMKENSAEKTNAGLPVLVSPTLRSPLATQTPKSVTTAQPTVSPTGTETPTPVLVDPLNSQPVSNSCGRPAGWVSYTVRRNDTLSQLSLSFGVTIAQLQTANCMGASTLLHVGQVLFVPPWAANPVSPVNPVNPVNPTFEPTWPTVIEVPTSTPTQEPTVTLPAPLEYVTPLPTNTDAIIPADTTNP